MEVADFEIGRVGVGGVKCGELNGKAMLKGGWLKGRGVAKELVEGGSEDYVAFQDDVVCDFADVGFEGRRAGMAVAATAVARSWDGSSLDQKGIHCSLF